MKEKTIVIVPARMASSRYPGKPLAKILDLPMIEHVRRRCLLAEGIDEVVVATCDQEIVDAVEAVGGKAVMTADTHERSSERVAEAMQWLEGDVVVVAQGDEPLMMPRDLELVAAPFNQQKELVSVSLLSPLEGEDDFNNPNIVKAACDQQGFIMFYSRAPIPYFQKQGTSPPIYRETGIRAFRVGFLSIYVNLSETPFEKVEAVDMMRLREHGHQVLGVVTDGTTMGVDHLEDVAIAEKGLRTDPVQQELYQKILQMGK
jgi:3-deoxy-manno-octulosonate cytidylyltransferase (CMP-KDO synthetase)